MAQQVTMANVKKTLNGTVEIGRTLYKPRQTEKQFSPLRNEEKKSTEQREGDK